MYFFMSNGLSISAIIAALSYGAKVYIDYWKSRRLLELEHGNQEIIREQNKADQLALQREAFFKEISGEKLEETLNDWMSLLTDKDRMNDIVEEQCKYNEKHKVNIKNRKMPSITSLMRMRTNILMYGSEKTIKIFSVFHRNIYISNSEVSDSDAQVNLILLAEMIASLKEDFTGYKITGEEILEISINDYHEEKIKIKFDEAKDIAFQLLRNRNII